MYTNVALCLSVSLSFCLSLCVSVSVCLSLSPPLPVSSSSPSLRRKVARLKEKDEKRLQVCYYIFQSMFSLCSVYFQCEGFAILTSKRLQDEYSRLVSGLAESGAISGSNDGGMADPILPKVCVYAAENV